MSKIKSYISAEEFDYMFEDELDSLDLDYQYYIWMEDKRIQENIEKKGSNNFFQNQ